MILDLGQFGGFLEATANFSNAVVVAMMPYVSDVATKLDLPLPQPIMQQIVQAGPNPLFEKRNGEMGGCGFVLKDRFEGEWIIGFQEGHLSKVESPRSFRMLQNPDEIQKLVGKVRMTKEEAVQMARDTLGKLGIPLESVFAEQEPQVEMPIKSRTGIVPYYTVKWLSPRSSSPDGGGESVVMEVNADAKRIESIDISSNSNLRRPWPKFEAEPVLRPKRLSANPEYAWKLLPIVLNAVDDYGQRLNLSIPRPLTTNHVARFFVGDNGGWPHSELELTNGWRFIYRNNMVSGYYAPDTLFDWDRRPVLIKDIDGKPKLSEADAIKLIRSTLKKLDYPDELVLLNFKPTVRKSAVPSVPRYCFWWNTLTKEKDDLVAKVEAEVDMEKGAIKSLYFDNKALWGQKPPIDVPLSPPSQPNRNTSASGNHIKVPKPEPSLRGLKPFVPQDKK